MAATKVPTMMGFKNAVALEALIIDHFKVKVHMYILESCYYIDTVKSEKDFNPGTSFIPVFWIFVSGAA